MRFKHEDTRLLGLLLGALILIHLAGTVLWPSARAEIDIIFSTIVVVAVVLHVRRVIDARLEANRRSSQAYQALLKLLPLRQPLPPMTGWAASPELAATIFSIIRTNKPASVVELGSGVSSIVAGYALELNGSGKLFSLDHDGAYLKRTAESASRHGLTNTTVFHAPLTDVNIEEAPWRWYDLREAALPESIDLLIVDGPPRETGRRARYPALPVLMDRLSSTAIVVLDDADRPDETEILEAWQQVGAWTVERVASEKGIAVLRRAT